MGPPFQTEQARADREFEIQQRSFEQYLSQKALLIQKREACAKNIRELGVLPEEAFTKFIDHDPKKVFINQDVVSYHLHQVMKRLHKVNSQLNQFSHVNKKAIEQYNSFSQQKEALLNRKIELDESEKVFHHPKRFIYFYQTINELIEVLDQRKDEAIARTFKQVATYFSEVFEKLVPAGQGKLVMIKNLNQVDFNPFPYLTLIQGPLERDQPLASISTENYVGVSIKARILPNIADFLGFLQ